MTQMDPVQLGILQGMAAGGVAGCPALFLSGMPWHALMFLGVALTSLWFIERAEREAA